MVGSFNKKTVKDVDLTGRRVLLRADYNVPDIAGKITDDFRLKQSVPTIEYILKQKPKALIIISHLGRPTNPFDRACSLAPVARHLGHLLDKRVHFVYDCVGDEVKEAANRLRAGDILLLENLRFHAGEEKNDPQFAKNIVEATGAEIFVQDGFGVVHRAHASTSAITKLLPSVAGLLLAKEVKTITKVIKTPERPLLAVVGGVKISDKIDVLERFINLVDCLAVGGAIANNFLKIAGYPIGKSIYDEADLDIAEEILNKAKAKSKKQAFTFFVPMDVVVSRPADGKAPTRIVDLASHALADIEAYPKIPRYDFYTVDREEAILDIGPMSAARMVGIIDMARTVIWNGTLGKAEVEGLAAAAAPFAHGSRLVAEAIIGPHNNHPARAYSLVGGGDTVGYLEAERLINDFSFVSTGGGAMLDLIAGKKMPGIEVLADK